MKYLSFLALLFIACSTSTNDIEVPNPFESEYVINEVTTDLDGTSFYSVSSNNFYNFSLSTTCEDIETCPTVDIFLIHNFDENIVYTKDFSSATTLSDVLLFPDGKCAVPFAVDSGTLEISKLEDGSFNGTFNVQSREINGYQPDPTIGCSESNYSSPGLRTLSFDGTFTSIEMDEVES